MVTVSTWIFSYAMALTSMPRTWLETPHYMLQPLMDRYKCMLYYGSASLLRSFSGYCMTGSKFTFNIQSYLHRSLAFTEALMPIGSATHACNFISCSAPPPFLSLSLSLSLSPPLSLPLSSSLFSFHFHLPSLI